MTTVLKIAWRSIWRNRRRTLISMSAVGFGLMLVIVYGGIMGGALSDAKRQLDNTGMGHVEITAPGWRMGRGVTQAIEAPAALAARLAPPPGTELGWRVLSRALITSARGGEGVEVQGVDWEREAMLAVHARDVREGVRPASGDDRGVLIGERLAKRLKVKVGAKVRIMAQRADGEIGADIFRVRGLFHSPSPMISERRVLVSAAAARSLLGLGDAAHLMVLQLDRADESDAVAARLRASLGAGYDVRSYGELLPALRAMEALADSVMLIAGLFVYLLVGLGIFNTMLMSVMERTREFGVLRAVGTRPGRVVAQVLGESFWIATLSVLLGLGAGLAITWYGSTTVLLDMSAAAGESFDIGGAVIGTAFKTKFSPAGALEAAAMVYLMALVTGLFPAWKVARLPPARALHSS